MEELCEQPAPGPPEEHKTKDRFFAVMGGFALRTTPTTALTITLDMLVKRWTMEIIRQYPTTAIDDKSKSGLPAKTAACFQAGARRPAHHLVGIEHGSPCLERDNNVPLLVEETCCW